MAVPAALTRGYSNSFLDMLQRITIARSEPPVLTQADLNTLDGVQA